MKKLSWFNKLMFFLNMVLSVLTLLAYVLPFLPPEIFPILAVLTLFLPVIMFVNLLFFAYWAIQIKRQMLLSGIVLLIGFTFINKTYKFRDDQKIAPSEFSIMSYNVRLFNKFGWSEKETVPIEISDFVKEQNPDFLCIQEYSETKHFDYSNFPYQYFLKKGAKIKTGQAIFSKYKIVNSGEIVFPNSDNSTIYADVKIKKDTIRIYSIHLESLKITNDVVEINKDINIIDKQKSNKIFLQISKGFKNQQLQAELIIAHKKECKFPVVICGDMNNSAFSYVYRNISKNLQDSFVVAGKGFGKTYSFQYYPARIDYIFADKRFSIQRFDNFTEIVDSDHFPIIMKFSMNKSSF